MHKIKIARFNPLADYKSLTKTNRRTIKKKFKNTSYADDFRESNWGVDRETRIDFYQDMSTLPHKKLFDSVKNRRLIFSLSSSASRLFMFILFNLDFRMDEITIRFAACKKQQLYLSNTSFIIGIEELEKKGIIKRIGIKRTPDYWKFFICPQIIFKGDSIKYFSKVLEIHTDYLTASTFK